MELARKVNPAPRAYARGIRGSLRGNNPFIPNFTIRAFWVRGKKLGITKEQIQKVVENPMAVDKSEKPVLISIGQFTKTLSLCVVYRIVKRTIRIITFYPAEKGRYERKILSG